MRYIAILWRMVLIVMAVLAAAAGPCVLIAAAAILLFLTSQGPELGRSVAESGVSGIGALVLACVIWALMSWYWARQLLDLRFKNRTEWQAKEIGQRLAPALPETIARIGLAKTDEDLPERQAYLLRRWLGFWVNWLPRLCAMAPFGIAAFSLAPSWREKGIGALLFLSVVCTAMAWSQARALLDARVDVPGRLVPRLLAAWRVWLLLLGALVCFGVAAIILMSDLSGSVRVFAIAALVLLLVLWRRHWLAARIGWKGRQPWLGIASLVFSAITISMFLLFPRELGQSFGAVGSVFLFFAALLPLIANLYVWASRWRVPVLLLVFGLLALLPQLQRDRHLVRGLPEVPPTGRIGMAFAVHDWIRNQPETLRNPPGAAWHDPEAVNDLPLVMVTTAGGGISAAVWTSLLLSALQDDHPPFAARIFAISGVSGGALGAAVFVAAVPPLGQPSNLALAACAPGQALHAVPNCRVSGIAAVALSVDFLGPLVAGFAFGDGVGPVLAPFGLRIRNRAEVLELTWEAACARAGCPAMAGRFHALRPDAEWRPALFLNGTHVESGKRVVTSPLAVTMRHFDDAFDFFALHGREIRLSTAALNAARFPYVTPAGLMRAVDGTARGHIADGGYFENYGAETGAEVLRAVRTILEENRRNGAMATLILGAAREFIAGGQGDRPTDDETVLRELHELLAKNRSVTPRSVLIEISSDPSLGERDLWRPATGQEAARCDTSAPRADPEAALPICGDGGEQFLTQTHAPVTALRGTRSARGVQTVRRVWRRAKEEDAEAVQFVLCPQGPAEEQRPPLGWSLSRRTREEIAEDVAALFRETPLLHPCRERNRIEMIRLRALLRGRPAL